MIHNLFDFGDAEAKEIMVPRIDMTFVQADATYQEVLDIFRQDMFTRLPVYEDSTDNVIGIINMKDFLLQNDTPEFSVRNLLREPYFLHMSTKILQICFWKCVNPPFLLRLCWTNTE